MRLHRSRSWFGQWDGLQAVGEGPRDESPSAAPRGRSQLRGCLLGDTLHNVADALTAIPLLVAFTLARRPTMKRYTYGYGRAELSYAPRCEVARRWSRCGDGEGVDGGVGDRYWPGGLEVEAAAQH